MLRLFRSSSPAGRAPLELRFVQDRVALFGKTMFWIAMTFLVVSSVLRFISSGSLNEPGRVYHVVATAFCLGVWFIARRRQPLAPRLLYTLDGTGTLGICVCTTLMGTQLAAAQPWGFFAGTLSVFHTTIARAVIIPSTPRRTLVITALCFLFLVGSSQSLPFANATWHPNERWLALIGPLTWSATGSALATLASNVIFGLRAEVEEARQLGQYTLERKIGAMGEVYRARHALLRRPTAVKLLARDVTPEQIRRFEREVQLTASLTHRNTISIYDFGRSDAGTFYYVMELLEGSNLQEIVERAGPLPPARVIHILLQTCAALSEAHGAGLIHRDIKPANIFLARLGGECDVVKVLDFGLVKHIHADAEAIESGVNSIIGTPLYLSPEAITSPESLDARSDLYALGGVAYFLLSGTPVFQARSIVEICGMHLHSPPEPLSRRSSRPIASDLERIIQECLAKDPAARPANAAILASRLRSCADAGTWSEADATAWWREGLSERKAHPVPTSPPEASATLQVDLGARLERPG